MYKTLQEQLAEGHLENMLLAEIADKAEENSNPKMNEGFMCKNKTSAKEMLDISDGIDKPLEEYAMNEDYKYDIKSIDILLNELLNKYHEIIKVKKDNLADYLSIYGRLYKNRKTYENDIHTIKTKLNELSKFANEINACYIWVKHIEPALCKRTNRKFNLFGIDFIDNYALFKANLIGDADEHFEIDPRPFNIGAYKITKIIEHNYTGGIFSFYTNVTSVI